MRTSFAVIGIVIVGLLGVGLARTGGDQQDNKGQQGQVCTLKVAGMTCGGCEAAVKSAAKKVDGVKDARVSYKTGTAEVTYDATKTSPQSIAKAITEKSGFKAEAPQPNKK